MTLWIPWFLIGFICCLSVVTLMSTRQRGTKHDQSEKETEDNETKYWWWM